MAAQQGGAPMEDPAAAGMPPEGAPAEGEMPPEEAPMPPEELLNQMAGVVQDIVDNTME